MSSSRHRQPRVSADHQDLAAEVLEISDRVAAVDRHLSELRDLQARAIALAASRGVPQRAMAGIVGVSAPRISQIAQSQPVDIGRKRLRDEWFKWQGWPDDRLRVLSGTPEDRPRAATFRAYVEQRGSD